MNIKQKIKLAKPVKLTISPKNKKNNSDNKVQKCTLLCVNIANLHIASMEGTVTLNILMLNVINRTVM